MKKVAVLGSTGSIGTQTLDVVRANDDLEVVGLAAGSNVEMLEKQIRSSVNYNNSTKKTDFSFFKNLSFLQIFLHYSLFSRSARANYL